MKESQTKTIFEKIIDREIPAHILYEDEACIAILDAFPTTKGQALIIPKKVIDYIFDVDDQTYAYLFLIAKKVGQALDKAFSPERTCIVVEGFEVPHVHIKLFPIYKNEKLDVTTSGTATTEELEMVLLEAKEHLSL